MIDIRGIDAFEILDRITDGFFALDNNWNFTYLNQEATRCFFRTSEDLVGKNVWIEFPEATELEFYKQYQKAIAHQVNVKFEAYYPPLNTWFEVRAYPSKNGLSVYFLDVTQRRKYALETEQHYRSLFAQNPDVVCFVDLAGNYLSVNDSMNRLLGYTEQELLHNSFIPLIANDDKEKTMNHFNQAAEGTIQNYEIKLLHKSGHYVSVNVTNIPIIVDGEIVGVFGIAKDITEQKKLWDQLEKTEELYRLISENAQDIISTASPDGIFHYISPAVKKLLGYEPDDLIGTKRFEYWHPDDAALLMETCIFQSSDVGIFSYRVRHKEGHYVWLETKVKVIQSENKEIGWILGIGRDISERKKTESELQKTKERLQSFIQNNADAMWVVDLEERVLETNDAFEAMFQWDSNDVIGNKLPIVPEFLKKTMQDVHKQVKSGEAVVGFETLRVRKDGSLVAVSTTISPIRNKDGAIAGLAGVCRNIDQIKAAEQEIRRTNERLASFIRNHVDAILILNQNETVRMVNDAFQTMFGYSAAEIEGKKLSDLTYIPVDRMSEVNNDYETLQLGRPVTGRETKRIKNDGTEIDILLSAFPILDSKKKCDGWSVVLRDITESKKAQEIFQNAEKLNMAGQLAAGIAHEIRNPITAIKGFVQLMKSGTKDKTQYYNIIASEIERIETILSELLILAKPQLNKYESKDIRVILAQVITLLNTQAILNNVQISTEIVTDETEIMCDENKLKQVFINYIKNAIEAMPKGGIIKVQLLKPQAGMVSVRIIDQGCGMSKEMLAKLGQAFYTTKDKGTGLGFMVSKTIIENHKGFIQVDSEENIGTTVEVKLPIYGSGGT